MSQESIQLYVYLSGLCLACWLIGYEMGVRRAKNMKGWLYGLPYSLVPTSKKKVGRPLGSKTKSRNKKSNGKRTPRVLDHDNAPH